MVFNLKHVLNFVVIKIYTYIIIIIKHYVMKQNNISETDLVDKTWSFSLGFSTNRNMELMKLTKDIKLSNDLSLYAYLGAISGFGIGFCHQTNYNKTGLISSVSYGSTSAGWETGSISLAKQWKKKNKNRFISFGLTLYK